MLKNLFFGIKKINLKKTTKRLLVVFIFVFLVGGLLLIPQLVAAAGILGGIGEMIGSLMLSIATVIVTVIGWLLTTVLLPVLVNVAQFNQFTNAPAVIDGWKVVRDICNMFFIVILLVISVGTVLGIQSYHYKNFLKKIILMAILINFSKTIAGFLIDVSQIIMLTFVAAFKDSMVIGFVEAFKLNELMTLTQSVSPTGEVTTDPMEAVFAAVLSVILAGVLSMVMIAMITMLVYRIVILWILIILSPFAYLASAMPGGTLAGQAKEWWSQFTKQLIVGPALAFFLWLTLMVVSTTGGKFYNEEAAGTVTGGIIGTKLSEAGYILNYFIGIMMLFVGMQMAQKMGGASGAAAGKAFSKAKAYGGRGLKMGGKFIGRRAQGALGGTIGAGIRGLARKTGAVEGGENAGSLLHMMAARSQDKLDKRIKASQKFGGKVMEKVGFGTDPNVLEAMSARVRLKERKRREKIGKDAEAEAKDQFDSSDSENDRKELKKKVVERFKRDKARPTSDEQAKKLYVQEAKQKAEKKADDLGQQAKSIYVTDKESERMSAEANRIRAEAEDKAGEKWESLGGDKQKKYINKYVESNWESQEVDEKKVDQEVKKEYVNKYTEAEVAKEDKKQKARATGFRPAYVSALNPLAGMYGYALDKTKKSARAAELGEVYKGTPQAFAAKEFIDVTGAVKIGLPEKAFGDYTEDNFKAIEADLKKKIKSGDKVEENEQELTGLLKISKYLAEKNPDSGAAKFHNQQVFDNVEVSPTKGKPKESIADMEIKSTKDFLTDIAPERVINTAVEIENEITNLKPSDKVRNSNGEEGWAVNRDKTDIAADRIVLQRGDETQEVGKDEFMQHNGPMLADHFYDSDRYKRLQKDKGEDYVLNKSEYDTYSRIQDYSQEGLTTGSLKRGGKTAAVNFDQLQERVGDITGEQRRAGMFVQGDEAVKAAKGLKEILTEQTEILNEADDDEAIQEALKSFGIQPKPGADLQTLKQDTLADAQESYDNLDNNDKVEKEGLILVNKARRGRAVKGLLRHEQTHEFIEGVDQDGSLQASMWEELSAEQKEQAREYIKKDRGQADMSDDEIKKEYLTDAVMNQYKPGGPDEDKPQLPAQALEKLSQAAGDKKLFGQKLSEFKTKSTVMQDEHISTNINGLNNDIANNTITPASARENLQGLKEFITSATPSLGLPSSDINRLIATIEELIGSLEGVDSFKEPKNKGILSRISGFAKSFIGIEDKDEGKPALATPGKRFKKGKAEAAQSGKKRKTGKAKPSILDKVKSVFGKQPAVRDKAEQIAEDIKGKEATPVKAKEDLQNLKEDVEKNGPSLGVDGNDTERLVAAINALITKLDNLQSFSESGGQQVMDNVAGFLRGFSGPATEEPATGEASEEVDSSVDLQPNLMQAEKPEAKVEAKPSQQRMVPGKPSPARAANFLQRPLTMRQFLLFKKWFQQQNEKIAKLGAGQTAISEEMQTKMSSLNAKIGSMDVEEGGTVDLRVMLEEQGFDASEIKKMVEDYTTKGGKESNEEVEDMDI